MPRRKTRPLKVEFFPPNPTFTIAEIVSSVRAAGGDAALTELLFEGIIEYEEEEQFLKAKADVVDLFDRLTNEKSAGPGHIEAIVERIDTYGRRRADRHGHSEYWADWWESAFRALAPLLSSHQLSRLAEKLDELEAEGDNRPVPGD